MGDSRGGSAGDVRGESIKPVEDTGGGSGDGDHDGSIGGARGGSVGDALAHNAQKTREFFSRTGTVGVPRPPYSLKSASYITRPIYV